MDGEAKPKCPTCGKVVRATGREKPGRVRASNLPPVAGTVGLPLSAEALTRLAVLAEATGFSRAAVVERCLREARYWLGHGQRAKYVELLAESGLTDSRKKNGQDA